MFSIRLQESLLSEVNRVRVVDNQQSSGVTIVEVQINLGSKPRSWTSSLHQSMLSYLSEDQALSTSAGVLFISLDGKQLKYVLQILWPTTNNEAEYEALLHGLRVVVSLRMERLLVYGDSSVVINQVNKDWDCTKETMDAYYAEVRKLEKHFQGLEIHHVVRDLNVAADVLAKLG